MEGRENSVMDAQLHTDINIDTKPTTWNVPYTFFFVWNILNILSVLLGHLRRLGIICFAAHIGNPKMKSWHCFAVSFLGGNQRQNGQWFSMSRAETTANQINRKWKHSTGQEQHAATALGVRQAAALNFRGFGSFSLFLFPDLFLITVQLGATPKHWAWTLQPGAIHTTSSSKPLRRQNCPEKPWEHLERPYVLYLLLCVLNDKRHHRCITLRDGPLL